MNVGNLTSINNIIINRKIVNIPVFFMLLAVKSFEIFAKHNRCGFLSEVLALN